MSVSERITALVVVAGLLAFCVFAHGRQEASDGVRYRAEIAGLETEFAGLRSRVASARGEAECWLAEADSESASQVLRLLDDLSDPVCESGSGAAFSVGDEVRLDAAPCIDVTVIEGGR